MIRYQKLSKHRRKFLAMTGYTVEEFEALLPHFRVEFEKHVAVYRLDGKKRVKRSYTEYKNSSLPSLEDKLLFILVYLKQGSLQEEHATLFGMHQPDANRWIHLLHAVLNRALAALGELPVREAEQRLEQSRDDDETILLFFHDGTERPIVRPKDKTLQKLFYSGKKKQHTVKNIVVINARCKIILLTHLWVLYLNTADKSRRLQENELGV
jgi:hypothetical protein